MTPRVSDRMAEFLERFSGMTHARMSSALKPYINEEMSPVALREAWLKRSPTIAPLTAMREKRCLEQLLGKRLHARIARKEK